jgi:hypothetical protein
MPQKKNAETIRREAWKEIGVTEYDVSCVASITYLIRLLPQGWTDALAAIRASGSPISKKFLQFWDSPKPGEVGAHRFTQRHRDSLPVEAFCVAAGITPMLLWEDIVVSLTRLNAQQGAILATLNHPAIVQTSIDQALTPEGFKDRELQLKHAGFVPMPKGNVINVNAVSNSQSQSRQLTFASPTPEDSIRRLTDRFNEKILAVPQLEAECIQTNTSTED